jgi:asparagine synthase (glutamine-hydrolysing)
MTLQWCGYGVERPAAPAVRHRAGGQRCRFETPRGRVGVRNFVCGWIDAERPTPDPERVLSKMAARVSRSHSQDDVRFIAGPIGLWARCDAGKSLVDDRFVVALWGEPHWTDNDPGRPSATAAQDLCRRFMERGPGLLEVLRGPCAFVVIDIKSRTAVLAIDRIGTFSLTHAAPPGGGLGSAQQQRHCSPPAVTSRLDAQALSTTSVSASPVEVRIRGPAKLKPAQYLIWRDGAARSIRMAAGVSRAPAMPVPISSARRTCGARSSALCNGRPHGCFLVVIDSSTIAECSHGFATNQSDLYHRFQRPEYKVEFARITARHFGATAHEYFVTKEDVFDAVPRIAAYYDEPFGNSSALPTYYCARMAKHDGTDVMLAGDGGDELFGGNVRYRKQLIFEAYQHLPAGARTRLLEPLLLGRSGLGQLPGLKKLRRYIEQALMPMPDRLESFNFLTLHSPREILDPALLSAIDVAEPSVLNRQVYESLPGAAMLDRMLYLDWKQTLADNDLRKVQRMCDLAGIGVRFPFLDDEVVDLSTRVPPDWKIRHYRLRSFFKRAMRDFLPPAVLRKSKHGFGLPFGIWMQQYAPLRELAYDSLTSLRQRHLISGAYLERLIDLHRHEHAGYFGEFVWVLMMLELWLQSHQ